MNKPQPPEPIWCLVCEDRPARGCLVFIADSSSVPVVPISVCEQCGKARDQLAVTLTRNGNKTIGHYCFIVDQAFKCV